MVWELINLSSQDKDPHEAYIIRPCGSFFRKKVALIPATMQNPISVPLSAHLQLRLRRFGDPATVHLF